MRKTEFMMVVNVNSKTETTEEILDKLQKVMYLENKYGDKIWFVIFQNSLLKEMFKVNNVSYSETFWLYQNM